MTFPFTLAIRIALQKPSSACESPWSSIPLPLTEYAFSLMVMARLHLLLFIPKLHFPQEASTNPSKLPLLLILVTNSPSGIITFLLVTLQEPHPACIRFKQKIDKDMAAKIFFIISID